jgi:hypothetical protein
MTSESVEIDEDTAGGARGRRPGAAQRLHGDEGQIDDVLYRIQASGAWANKTFPAITQGPGKVGDGRSPSRPVFTLLCVLLVPGGAPLRTSRAAADRRRAECRRPCCERATPCEEGVRLRHREIVDVSTGIAEERGDGDGDGLAAPIEQTRAQRDLGRGPPLPSRPTSVIGPRVCGSARSSTAKALGFPVSLPAVNNRCRPLRWERFARAPRRSSLRLAIKLAVDAGEYGRAAAVLDVLRRSERSGPP